MNIKEALQYSNSWNLTEIPKKLESDFGAFQRKSVSRLYCFKSNENLF